MKLRIMQLKNQPNMHLQAEISLLLIYLLLPQRPHERGITITGYTLKKASSW